MSGPRRKRSDSTERQVEIASGLAAGSIEPPAHVKLRERDRPYWLAVIGSRARELWTDADLINVGTLARAMADVERLQQELDREGDTILTDRGPILNPKHALCELQAKRVQTLCRMLQVAPTVSVKRRDADQAKKTEAAIAIAVVPKKQPADDYIFRPSLN